MEDTFKHSVIEGLILSSPEPLPVRRIVNVVDNMTPSGVGQAVAELNNRYMQAGSSFRIREMAGGYQFFVMPEFAGYVQELFSRQRKMRLTRASLETLAIIAWRQPVTRTEIEHIRGVASDGVVRNLLEKKLITMKGRAKTIGRPLQYGTTSEFLKLFGLASLVDLPKMSEIVEMISAREPQPQTELDLPDAIGAEIPLKLNVADGTCETDREQESDSVEIMAPNVSNLPETPVPSNEMDETNNRDEVVPSPENIETTSEENEPCSGVMIDIDTTS